MENLLLEADADAWVFRTLPQRGGTGDRLFAISRVTSGPDLLAIGFNSPRHSGLELAGHSANRWRDDRQLRPRPDVLRRSVRSCRA